VLVTSQDAASGAPITRSVNSCLTPVFNCLNSEVITAEAIGAEVPGKGMYQLNVAPRSRFAST
jgi:hypothetical protein